MKAGTRTLRLNRLLTTLQHDYPRICLKTGVNFLSGMKADWFHKKVLQRLNLLGEDIDSASAVCATITKLYSIGMLNLSTVRAVCLLSTMDKGPKDIAQKKRVDALITKLQEAGIQDNDFAIIGSLPTTYVTQQEGRQIGPYAVPWVEYIVAAQRQAGAFKVAAGIPKELPVGAASEEERVSYRGVTTRAKRPARELTL